MTSRDTTSAANGGSNGAGSFPDCKMITVPPVAPAPPPPLVRSEHATANSRIGRQISGFERIRLWWREREISRAARGLESLGYQVAEYRQAIIAAMSR